MSDDSPSLAVTCPTCMGMRTVPKRVAEIMAEYDQWDGSTPTEPDKPCPTCHGTAATPKEDAG